MDALENATTSVILPGDRDPRGAFQVSLWVVIALDDVRDLFDEALRDLLPFCLIVL